MFPQVILSKWHPFVLLKEIADLPLTTKKSCAVLHTSGHAVSLMYRITVFTPSGLYNGLVTATHAVPATRQVSQAANTTICTQYEHEIQRMGRWQSVHRSYIRLSTDLVHNRYSYTMSLLFWVLFISFVWKMECNFFSYCLLLPCATHLPPAIKPLVWIVGDFIVQWNSRVPASSTAGVVLEDVDTVRWLEKWGLHLNEFNDFLYRCWMMEQATLTISLFTWVQTIWGFSPNKRQESWLNAY